MSGTPQRCEARSPRSRSPTGSTRFHVAQPGQRAAGCAIGVNGAMLTLKLTRAARACIQYGITDHSPRHAHGAITLLRICWSETPQRAYAMHRAMTFQKSCWKVAALVAGTTDQAVHSSHSALNLALNATDYDVYTSAALES